MMFGVIRQSVSQECAERFLVSNWGGEASALVGSCQLLDSWLVGGFIYFISTNDLFRPSDSRPNFGVLLIGVRLWFLIKIL